MYGKTNTNKQLTGLMVGISCIDCVDNTVILRIYTCHIIPMKYSIICSLTGKQTLMFTKKCLYKKFIFLWTFLHFCFISKDYKMGLSDPRPNWHTCPFTTSTSLFITWKHCNNFSLISFFVSFRSVSTDRWTGGQAAMMGRRTYNQNGLIKWFYQHS